MKKLKKSSRKLRNKIPDIMDIAKLIWNYVNYKVILRITNKLSIICTKFIRKSCKFSTYKGIQILHDGFQWNNDYQEGLFRSVFRYVYRRNSIISIIEF